MDMSELDRSEKLSAAGSAVAAAAARRGDGAERWHGLVAEIGAEIASPLTAALERIHALTATGKIDRDSLRALRDEVERARLTGLIGQQITRLASGRLRQSPERLHLSQMLDGLLTHRGRETQARQIALRTAFKPTEVVADASLLFTLLNTALDWAFANAHAPAELAMDVKTSPARARLTFKFANPPAPAPEQNSPHESHSLAWRLLEQTAWAMGVTIDRRHGHGLTMLALDFQRSGNDAIEGVSATELDDGFAPSANSQPLAGSHVLVIASRRELRVQIREALRNMSLILDFVNSVDEAAAFCAEGLPHAIVIESIQSGERFANFRTEISNEVPGFVFIEILEEGNAFEMSGLGGSPVARVGRGVLRGSLPSALIFELSKCS